MKVFFSYSHANAIVRDQLDTHCAMLRRNGEIESWHDRRILGGEDLDEAIKFELEHADLVLLLISPEFLASNYCYGVELARALERKKEGTCHILPVIAEVCDWKNSPLGKLKAFPNDGKPLSKHPNINDGLLEVVGEIRRIREKVTLGRKSSTQLEEVKKQTGTMAPPEIRSSNLSLRKHYSAADRDRFLFASFEYMANFFDESLKELEARNHGIEAIYRRVTSNVFVATVYRNGASVSQCQVSVGKAIGRVNQITYSNVIKENTFSESLSVEDDGHVLYLRPANWGFSRKETVNELSQQGASEYYWSMLLEPLQ